MPKRVISVWENRPFLDLVSHSRGGPPRQQIHLTCDQIEQISRTVRRTPEVVIKVLPKDSNNARSIQGHINYIGRKGNLEIETDDGTLVHGKDVGKQILEDWDLDLEANKRETEFSAARGRSTAKLIHKLVFSMPPGTPPQALSTAVRNFALEMFALQHRYLMMLHTDEPHPHVHVVVKAVSEQGIRLNISRETLRVWRSRFAHHLRQEGIAANATDRFVRGEIQKAKKDGIYRANQRGDSTYVRAHTEAVAVELLKGQGAEAGKRALIHTREKVTRGFYSIADRLDQEGRYDLASITRRYVSQFPTVRTERDLAAARIIERMQSHRNIHSLTR